MQRLVFQLVRTKFTKKKICADKYGPDFVLGKNWVRQWSEQFSALIKNQASTSLDSVCSQALNPSTVEHWFETVKAALEKYQIKLENIYGADETGIHNDDVGQHRVFIPFNMKQVYMQNNAIRESFTLLVMACADGSVFPPTVIFQGQNLQEEWVKSNPLGAS